jgi:hypothetical protein
MYLKLQIGKFVNGAASALLAVALVMMVGTMLLDESGIDLTFILIFGGISYLLLSSILAFFYFIEVGKKTSALDEYSSDLHSQEIIDADFLKDPAAKQAIAGELKGFHPLKFWLVILSIIQIIFCAGLLVNFSWKLAFHNIWAALMGLFIVVLFLSAFHTLLFLRSVQLK